ncbi:CsbD family protein [Iodidimonas muriae]|uniref:CsbD family protein n=1 Tax=Iodidimonas muriae TaxID=261467 RepID=A0ABQ2LED7_9PROT|nr:CsbD family protein [Iodidimonas muriae]GER07600.1 CsbD family protein [Kordiimonadales bacterium JCM 17843]GGO13778.1 CsbD family protein [Iodidimonas muriae]
MEKNIFEGKWKQIKGDVQAKWGEITNDELDQIEGNRQKLAGKIQEKYGRSKLQAEHELEEFERKYKDRHR